jgi:hypothetical protein
VRRQPLKGAKGIHASTGARPDITTIMLYRSWLEKYQRKIQQGPFDELAFWKEWIEKVITSIQGEYEHIALDKGIPFTQLELRELWEGFYAPFKMILVHRNPDDKIAENIRQLGWTEFLQGSSKEQQIWKQLDQIEFELSCYEKLIRMDSDHYLALPFEGLVEDFPTWEPRLSSWLFENKVRYRNHVDKPNFDPEKSKLNVGIISQNSELLDLLSQHEEQLARIAEIRGRLIFLSLQ